MSKPLSERLARGAIVMRDTAQMKTQYPEWLIKEMDQSADLLDEAAALARRVEESAKAIGSKDACTDECASIIMHIGNGGRAKDARGKWFHLVPAEGGS